MNYLIALKQEDKIINFSIKNVEVIISNECAIFTDDEYEDDVRCIVPLRILYFIRIEEEKEAETIPVEVRTISVDEDDFDNEGDSEEKKCPDKEEAIDKALKKFFNA